MWTHIGNPSAAILLYRPQSTSVPENVLVGRQLYIEDGDTDNIYLCYIYIYYILQRKLTAY